MKEEIYVIRGGERFRLDLNSPSGITLNYVNNLFSDLSKLSSSYSYTFNLPLTENNRLALDIIDDIRHDGETNKKKLPAEYYQNGIALFKKCNLYIDSVKDGAISCCFTWGIIDGLEELSKHDKPLNELEGDDNYRHYEWDSDYDFTHEKDEYVTILDDFDTYTADNLRKGVAYPYYNAGTDNGRGSVSVDRFSSPVTRNSENTIPETPVRIDIYPKSEHEGVYTSPAPVVKVSKIVKRINDTYGINLKFEGDFYKSLYLPLVSLKKSDGLLKQVYADGDSKSFLCHHYGDQLGVDAIIVAYQEAHIHSNITSYEGLEIVSHSFYPVDPATEAYDEETLYVFHISDQHTMSLALDGYVDIELDFSGQSHPFPEGGFSVNFEIRALGDTEFENTLFSTSKKTTGTDLRFDFRMSLGFENAKTDRFYTTSSFIFTVSINDIAGFRQEHIVKKVDLSHLKVYVNRGAGDLNYKANLYMNLPDISCMEFVKSLYYIIGGFPCIDDKGNILVRFYEDITKCFLEGTTLDWTSKVLYPNDKQLDLTFIGDTLSYLAQNNYYLMSNDEVDSYGNPKPPYKYGEDRYEHSYGNIVINNSNLPLAETIIKLPYSGKFLANKKATALFTGRTTDLWKCDGTFVSGGDGAKAMIGTLDLQETWHDASETEPEYDPSDDNGGNEPPVIDTWTHFKLQRSTIMLGFKVWQLPADMAKDPRYNVLAAVFNNPYEVVEYMNLSEVDLMTFDYATPVYLEQYNSYFIVSKIERDSDGVSKVNFMRLDMSLLDLDGARRRQSEHSFTVRCDLIQADNIPNQRAASESMYGVLPNSASVRYLNYTAGATIPIPKYNFYEYAFYDGKQVVPDTVAKNLYVDGVLHNSDDVVFRSGMVITREAIVTYMGYTARWKRSIVYRASSEMTDPVTDWGLVCNRPYTFLRIQNGDTVKASELGVNYVEVNVRCDHPTLGHLTNGMIAYANTPRQFYARRLMPERDCELSLTVLHNGNVIDNIYFNYVYDIDTHTQPEISVGEAIWNSTHMNSDSYA